jgi:Na+/H+ antiporter NhaB
VCRLIFALSSLYFAKRYVEGIFKHNLFSFRDVILKLSLALHFISSYLRKFIEKVKQLIKIYGIGDTKILLKTIKSDNIPKAEERHQLWNTENK